MTHTIRSQADIEIRVHPFGASWTSCVLPIGTGREILLAHADMEDARTSGAYLGSTVGRYAGRIRAGRCSGMQLSQNDGNNHLHGGFTGCAHRLWQVESQSAEHIAFTLISPAGEEGYAGNAELFTEYRFIAPDTLRISWCAAADAPTVINLTNHAYFSLGGEGAPALTQTLWLDSRAFVPVGADGLPTATAEPVAGCMDFSKAKRLGAGINDGFLKPTGGYDHSFLVEQTGRPQAVLQSADGSAALHITTTQPAIHLYTGQYLAGTPSRSGGTYPNFAGIALETQAPPDSPNLQPALVTVTPERPYAHHSDYLFVWA